MTIPSYYSYGCISLVDDAFRPEGYRDCGRWGWHTKPGEPELDLLRHQPLCWQHEKRVEDDLKERHVQITRFEEPHLPSLDLARVEPYRRSCWWAVALEDREYRRCGATIELKESFMGGFYPPDVPLCTLHADILTSHFIERWNQFRDMRPRGLRWGQSEARDHGLPYRPRIVLLGA